MRLNASQLRANIYRILDQVADTGVPVEIVRRRRRLKIVPADDARPRKLDRLALWIACLLLYTGVRVENFFLVPPPLAALLLWHRRCRLALGLAGAAALTLFVAFSVVIDKQNHNWQIRMTNIVPTRSCRRWRRSSKPAACRPNRRCWRRRDACWRPTTLPSSPPRSSSSAGSTSSRGPPTPRLAAHARASRDAGRRDGPRPRWPYVFASG
ncbi:MAG: hypothetical protein U0802_01720 [Candidatus Binatia bacterium]